MPLFAGVGTDLAMTQSNANPNVAALAYLKDYCDSGRERDFAVLLDGPWGCGKTFFIKSFLKDYCPDRLYVSLYGISDVEQINDELYQQLHPVRTSKPMRILGRVTKGLVKGALKIDLDGDGKEDGTVSISIPDMDLTKKVSGTKSRLLVFDDLERCSLQVSEVLGYINAFVEHEGVKAIIIANEAEITKADVDNKKEAAAYLRIKEKLIGQTLRISTSVEEVYAVFLEGLSNDKTKAFLEAQSEHVIGIHKQSKKGNLRLLKQALWAYERVAECLLDEHWQNEAAMRSLMSIVLALSIEHRAGRVNNAEQIDSILNLGVYRAMKRKEGEQKCVETEIEELYSTIAFYDRVLDPELVIEAVLHGFVDKVTLHKSLARSHYFLDPVDTPLWRRAWDYFDLTDDDADRVAAEFMIAFDEREFAEQGIVYHAFGILLRYSDLGLVKLSREDAVAACNQYVDDLVNAGRLQDDPDRDSFFHFGGTYEGHGFMERETEEFQGTVAYYAAAADKIAKSRFPDHVRELLASLKAGSEDFFLDLTSNEIRASRFRNKPILASIPPAEFVSELMTTTPEQQRLVFKAFKERYQFASSDEPLASEKPWLKEVYSLLETERQSARPLTSDRLRVYIEHSLDPIMKRWDREEKAAEMAQAAQQET